MNQQHDMHDTYEHLTPDTVIEAVESAGFQADARILSLNSYENRVYQVGIVDQPPLIAKFYRPHRWSDEAILEEHQFTQELHDHEIPVVPPQPNGTGDTLQYYGGYRFALYPSYGGYAPEPGNLDQLEGLGRLVARIHACGATKPFQHRPTINLEHYVTRPSQNLLENDFIPRELRNQYEAIIGQVSLQSSAIMEDRSDITFIRTHSDFHMGNILYRPDDGIHLVDFDDCRMAPAVQDMWMMLAGDRQQQTRQLMTLLDGYDAFNQFNVRELRLIEALRAFRMIHYAGWLAHRWTDPAFPLNFPWFNTQQYWQQHICDLENQLTAMAAPTLAVVP